MYCARFGRDQQPFHDEGRSRAEGVIDTHRVLRAHVDDHLRLVLPLPAEARVRELVELCAGRENSASAPLRMHERKKSLQDKKEQRTTPRQLLGEEELQPRQPRNLRTGRIVPKRVGQPPSLAVLSEAGVEVALAVEELAREGFARREELVRLDPHAACPLAHQYLLGFPHRKGGARRTDRDELPLLHALPNLLEKQGIVLLEPLELLSLRRNEAVFGVASDEVKLGRPGAAPTIRVNV